MKKYFWLTICLILVISITSFIIWNIREGPKEEGPRLEEVSFSVIDSRGKEIFLDKKPERIISLAPANTEILFALGLDEEIVGITDYCDYPPDKVAQKEKIGGFATPNLEKIIFLNPDIVFGTSGVQTKIVKDLEELDVKVYVLEAETIEKLLHEIKNIGILTGKSLEAQELTRALQKRIELVEEKVGELLPNQKPKVFLEVWGDPLWTAPSETLMYQIIELAGGKHTVTVKGDWNQVTIVDPESVINANPEIILLTYEGANPELLYKRTGWNTILAIQNKQVYQINPDIISRPGPRIIDALEEIAKILHPELF